MGATGCAAARRDTHPAACTARHGARCATSRAGWRTWLCAGGAPLRRMSEQRCPLGGGGGADDQEKGRVPAPRIRPPISRGLQRLSNLGGRHLPLSAAAGLRRRTEQERAAAGVGPAAQRGRFGATFGARRRLDASPAHAQPYGPHASDEHTVKERKKERERRGSSGHRGEEGARIERTVCVAWKVEFFFWGVGLAAERDESRKSEK